MHTIITAIKRCDTLLISALAHTKQGRAQAALADLRLAQTQLNAILHLIPKAQSTK